MIRKLFLDRIQFKFENFPIVALLGPRQSGKTTLARQFTKRQSVFPSESNYFDLEDPIALSRLDQPRLALENLNGLVVIDEIQRKPELFQVLRYIVDRENQNLRLLLLGSASRELIKQSSESLAGRIAYIEVTPFTIAEKLGLDLKQLWLKGGFPRSYLAKNDLMAFDWLKEYIRTYLEMDIPSLGINIHAQSLRRLWMMLSHNHSQLINFSALGRSFGAADTTIRSYIDILEATFMVRTLKPFFTNIKKRQVKTPKIYFRDSGVFHSFAGVNSMAQLVNHLSLGYSWEGFALEQVIQQENARSEECYFWRTHDGNEIDLIIERSGKLKAFEFKYSDSPQVTKSIKVGMDLLDLEELTIITPTGGSYPLSNKVKVHSLFSDISPK